MRTRGYDVALTHGQLNSRNGVFILNASSGAYYRSMNPRAQKVVDGHSLHTVKITFIAKI
jgi:hypothetical protein